MLLLIDIGNTSTTIGIHYKDEIKDVLRIDTVREEEDIGKSSVLLDGFLKKHASAVPEDVVLCSVVPESTSLVAGMIKKKCGIEPLCITHKLKTGLNFNIDNAEGLGTDRIANAVAAREFYSGDLLVVDFGTATTFCVITSDGEYIGGAIMPGPKISADCLAEKTAKLPVVRLKKPEKILGGNTSENILTGLVVGHAGAVERILTEIKKETGRSMKVIATGGLSGLITGYIKMIDYTNPLLTLEGLKLLYKKNTG